MSVRASWLRLLRVVHNALLWCDRRMPRGTRVLLGIPLVILAPFGFLPVLGFWMLPVGLGLIALEVPSWRRRLLHWLACQQPQSARPDSAPARTGRAEAP
jgi:hypothetical protein